MRLLQTFNPDKYDFLRPHHSYIPGWLGIFLLIALLGLSLYIYFSLRKKKKKGISQRDIERQSIKELKQLFKKSH